MRHSPKGQIARSCATGTQSVRAFVCAKLWRASPSHFPKGSRRTRRARDCPTSISDAPTSKMWTEQGSVLWKRVPMALRQPESAYALPELRSGANRVRWRSQVAKRLRQSKIGGSLQASAADNAESIGEATPLLAPAHRCLFWQQVLTGLRLAEQVGSTYVLRVLGESGSSLFETSTPEGRRNSPEFEPPESTPFGSPTS